MNKKLLFWIYLLNSIALINHEIDSAYWQEWKLFGLGGGISGFLILHFALVFLVLIGLIFVYGQKKSAQIFSLILAFSGIFAFFIHFYFIFRGRIEFSTAISEFILFTTLILSVIQLFLSIKILVRPGKNRL